MPTKHHRSQICQDLSSLSTDVPLPIRAVDRRNARAGKIQNHIHVRREWIFSMTSHINNYCIWGLRYASRYSTAWVIFAGLVAATRVCTTRVRRRRATKSLLPDQSFREVICSSTSRGWRTSAAIVRKCAAAQLRGHHRYCPWCCPTMWVAVQEWSAGDTLYMQWNATRLTRTLNQALWR